MNICEREESVDRGFYKYVNRDWKGDCMEMMTMTTETMMTDSVRYGKNREASGDVAVSDDSCRED